MKFIFKFKQLFYIYIIKCLIYLLFCVNFFNKKNFQKFLMLKFVFNSNEILNICIRLFNCCKKLLIVLIKTLIIVFTSIYWLSFVQIPCNFYQYFIKNPLNLKLFNIQVVSYLLIQRLAILLYYLANFLIVKIILNILFYPIKSNSENCR